MHRRDGTLFLAATDLANHLACGHLTELNRLVSEGTLKRPFRNDPVLETLIERGNIHENSYVDHLNGTGLAVIDVGVGSDRADRTIEAIKRGVNVIVQPALIHQQWMGFADLLLRIDVPSEVGEWSYEVADTKLALHTRAGTVLQLCLYSDLLAQIQGRLPLSMMVVKPGNPFDTESLRVDDFMAYYRVVKSKLQQILQAESQSTYPEPVPHCEICNWWSRCNQQRRDDDHLSFVAGIRRSQIEELREGGIQTLRHFATASEPVSTAPKRGSLASFARIQQQARIQFEARENDDLRYEFLDVEEGRGLCRLPEPDAGDIFFDIEGDPHAQDGVHEYLLGFAFYDDPANLKYESFWGLTRDTEKRSFEQFIDFVMNRWAQFPAFHIYHFAPYETSAMKRLATRHATREEEVDRLLRAERFIDLYAVVRQGLRASVESYSIKKLEPFYGYKRLEELADARHALHRLERALEFGLAGEIESSDRDVVETYNKDDCLSTVALRDWLGERRDELLTTGQKIPRPALLGGEATETVEAQQDAINQLADALVRTVESDDRTEDEQARWLLANLLGYFRREDKCAWWEFFRLHELEPDELLRERHAISGLSFVKEIPPADGRQSARHRYSFPVQEVTIETDDQLHEVGGDRIGTVTGINHERCLIDIRPAAVAQDVRPTDVFAHTHIPVQTLQDSILAFASAVLDSHRTTSEPQTARYDLLCKRPPRLRTVTLPMVADDMTLVATQIAFDLDDSVLAIQGPPGAGKTHVGSRMIAALATAGKSVGITAVSHKVIRNMLTTIRDAPEGAGVQLAHRHGSQTRFHQGIESVGNTDNALSALDEGKIVGGTAWLWANQQLDQRLDYLFVDEAGQMSLAMVLAAGRAAKNIVLLGDPQQLEQPQRGTHPEGAEVAALKHLIDSDDTISDDRGLFLSETWRLHPDICRYTSEQFYDGRLTSRNGLDQQAIDGQSPLTGSGLFFVPVEHDGNQARSDEEIESVRRIVATLLDGEHRWTNADGTASELTANDLLIVAPYNAQVAAIRRALGNQARVGTVDKFQGQEAPVVIYSLTSSSVEDAPRGMEFVLSPNRLNVATSRAKCIVILVGSPALFEPECRSIGQMRLANGLCRFRELATELTMDAIGNG